MSLRIAPAVESALSWAQAVVVLESTVITHGLPYPENLETALELERTVRETGATPATVAVIGGEIVVGASEKQLAELADGDADKASLWNLSALSAAGANAGTTVAATLHIASRAGIAVFATGGIGGVHPQPFDESADLVALARYPVITVCSGPKSILDARATLERLESAGVPVVGYRSRRLAGFHVPETEIELPAAADTATELARMFSSHRSLGLPGGLLVSNPVSRGLDVSDVQRWRAQAEGEASDAGLTGKEVTPFMLRRLAELSQHRTVAINLRLLHENAALAAAIAVEYAALDRESGSPIGAGHE